MNQERLTETAQNERDEDSRSVVSVIYKNQLKQLLRALNKLPTDFPSIYLDASGIVNDTLDDLQLFLPTTNTLYLIDLRRLGDTAFITVGHSEISLRLILESRGIPKAGFDIRDL
ncbi:hypothetical protein FVEN_g12964 [Fusarium venenatum]|uniref:3'-5' exonuclease domain-containing protein n=2 Tax=Fusarium venenatum TaxID=56646 RepID=A0A2L2TCJ5_9HYPO|nr:uncharacterized protein FVRRES_04181 [Fusarium venenatum]KAG8352436.1 hypothetical protein FVEN_g12964 [Fusarium venenatum]CEI67669.1 unnamed protein product [Fusarium venenatum]